MFHLIHALSSTGWVTDSLLSKIEKDPTLSKAFQDPAMAQALAQFQTNPQLALAAANDKPEVREIPGRQGGKGVGRVRGGKEGI